MNTINFFYMDLDMEKRRQYVFQEIQFRLNFVKNELY